MADPALARKGGAIHGEGFIVHQLLHGYSDGHRLLAASMPLSRESSRMIGYLSDLSGPTLPRGFEGYVTGYPVPDQRAYALAKTWSAPEMPRPGCVWTHTLLIDANLVARLDSLNNLLPLFTRPSNGDFMGYDRPLDYHPPRRTGKESPANEMPARAMRAALWKIYGPNPEPLILEASGASQWEPLFFAIWALGWPALRMKVSFCTGLLSSRTAGGEPFDMQAAPPTVYREVARELRASRRDIGLLSGEEDLPGWVSVAARYLGERSSFAEFLAALAAPDMDRSCFALLAEIGSLCLHHNDETAPVRALLALLAERFPAPDQGTRLKITLLEGPLLRCFQSPLGEAALLSELAVTTHVGCFLGIDLKLKPRGLALWRQDRLRAKSLLLELFRAPLNSLGEHILRGLIDGLGEDEALALAKSDPDLLIAAVRVHPSLAASTALWEVFESRQRYLLDAIAVSQRELSDLEIDRIVSALLETGTEEIPQPVFKAFGRYAVSSALNWIQEHPVWISGGWTRALAQYPDDVLKWLAANSHRSDRVALLLGASMNPSSPEVIRQGTGIWLSAAEKIETLSNDGARTSFRVFLLAFALENPQPYPERLAEISFAGVHRSVEQSSLDYETWQVLERKLPELGWTHSWDRCERLRRGLVEAFVRFQWPAETLARCAHDKALFKSLRKSAYKVSGGEELIERVMKAVRHPR